MINNRTDAWKTDINLLNLGLSHGKAWALCSKVSKFSRVDYLCNVTILGFNSTIKLWEEIWFIQEILVLAAILSKLQVVKNQRMHTADSQRWVRRIKFALVTRRPYCPGLPKKLCFTTLSLIHMVSIARLSVVKQSFFGLPGQYGCHVTRVNGIPSSVILLGMKQVMPTMK